MQIGELAKRSGFSRDTIRYYEKLGLITEGMNRRTDNGYKHYPAEALARLNQIRRLKECGFALLEIRRLLTSDRGSPACNGLPARLTQKISKIDEKIIVLLEHKQSLQRIQQSCNGACGTTQGMPDCIPRPTLKAKSGACC